MQVKKEPNEVFDELAKGESYKQNIGLYENVRRNNNFFHDRQWEGVNAPNLDKPVFNIIKPAVRYYIGQLVSDDIGVGFDFSETAGELGKLIEDMLQRKIDDVFERVRFNQLTRLLIQNAAVDGDGCLYFYWDNENEAVMAQAVNNTDVFFGDAANAEAQEQPFIIIKQRMLVENLKAYAKSMGCADWEMIVPSQGSVDEYNSEHLPDGYVDVAIKFWKEGANVHWLMCTKDVVIVPDTDLRIGRFPIVWMPWERDKNSYHGISPVTGQINNQIFVNKIYAMAMEYQKNFAFPKLLYDATVIPKWSNKVGQAIAVNGNPQQALFASFAPTGMNSQALELAESTINKAKDALGVYDAALGNVKPDNTSAIIAVQQASAQPLNAQKLDFYQAVEDCVRIVLEFIKSYEPVVVCDGQMFNLQSLDFNKMSLKVEIGAASYWSELLNVQTLDNMMRMGIIPDAVTYLESIPDGYVKNKGELIRAIKEKQMMMQHMSAQAGDIPKARAGVRA